MDFFEHQDVARKKAGRLILMFGVAVVLIVILVYLAVSVTLFGASFYASSQSASGGAPTGPSPELTIWNPALFLGVAGGVLLLVAGSTMFKISQLSSGGQVVANALGGQKINTHTQDADERKLLNVVEEMAIASGTPVPPVYIMEEKGINAFAAGYSPSDAVIGVTRGCVEQLSRDELQGVIAHEFSHILNGDMRVNIRLMGVIFGIMVIGYVGYFVFRSALYSGAMHRARKKGNPMPLIALGLALMAIGFVGTIFGNMIKAAVSRQREFLADASAVQFTRYPDGIGGALKKIAGYSAGSKIEHPKAEESSHMFFGQAISSGLAGLFATHPPLKERIQRIDRGFDAGELREESSVKGAPAGAAGFAGQSAEVDRASKAPPPKSAVEQIGAPTREHVTYAKKLLVSIPDPILERAHDVEGARAVVYGLLLEEDDPNIRRTQLDWLAKHAEPGVGDLISEIESDFSRVKREARLPLIDLTIASLREMTQEQFETFEKNLDALIRADNRLDLFEWVLRHIIVHHVTPTYTRTRPGGVKHRTLKPVVDDVRSLLSSLAWAGAADEAEAQRAFSKAVAQLGHGQMALLSKGEVGLGAIDKAMDELQGLAPFAKRRVVLAAAACVTADREITAREAELLRAVCDALDCPMPPLLPGQPLS